MERLNFLIATFACASHTSTDVNEFNTVSTAFMGDEYELHTNFTKGESTWMKKFCGVWNQAVSLAERCLSSPIPNRKSRVHSSPFSTFWVGHNIEKLEMTSYHSCF